eukprot:TRINITY_DN921_c0_g1_i4.p1 TRINITY_DN921_c0_g1~~TRINITY_DN921_c0_g1_i4.p1  ORF type:complete len:183 (+),score=53.36 TRINITY_DN921_c0_g1_i4:1232-1780(+)
MERARKFKEQMELQVRTLQAENETLGQELTRFKQERESFFEQNKSLKAHEEELTKIIEELKNPPIPELSFLSKLEEEKSYAQVIAILKNEVEKLQGRVDLKQQILNRQFAVESQVAEKEALYNSLKEKYFTSLALNVKLTNSLAGKNLNVSANDLYTEAVKKNIAVDDYNKWINQQFEKLSN